MADDMAKTSFEKTLLQITGVIATLGGVITVISTVSKQLAEATGILGTLSTWQLAFLSVALFFAAVWTFAFSRRRLSILAKPEALRLDRSNPAHLKGREEDLERLVPLVISERLLFVEGESGAGKSALLQAGLLPKLRLNPGLMPIFVESLAGEDWEHAPRRLVALALTAAMAITFTPEQRQQLFPTDVVDPETVLERLGQMLSKLGRTPILLFDQFDDYQNRFLDRFLIQKSWLKPNDLIAANGFWAELRTLLDAGRLHCLVVTRTDTAGGLASIQFRTPTIYRIDRMKVQFVAEIFDMLVGSAEAKVVTDPDRGWTEVVKRLAADLERGDAVLPQQLRIVLLGLGTIPKRTMTVNALDRAGGVFGLEAGFVEGCVSRVARLSNLQPGQLRSILLAMVDPHTGTKTIELTIEQIAAATPDIDPAKLAIALDEFERLEVTRRRGDAATQAARWLLDHDYLARAVREADRRANRWTRILAEGTAKLQLAGTSFAARWRALLSPAVQLAFLTDRLRGRFRYGPHRPYALRSTMRLTPYAMAIVALIGIGANEVRRADERRREQAIAQQLNRLTFGTASSGSSGVEIQLGPYPQRPSVIDQEDGAALIALARMDHRSRLDAFRVELTDFSRRKKLLRQPTALLTAIFATSPSQRAAGVTVLLAFASDMLVSSRYETDAVRAIAVSSIFLNCSAEISISWWLAALEANKAEIAVVNAIESVFAQIGAAYTAQQAREAIPQFLAAISTSRSAPLSLAALIRGVARFGDYMTPNQTKLVTSALLSLISADQDGFFGAGWAVELAPLVEKMTSEQLKTLLSTFFNKTNKRYFDWLNQFVGDWSSVFTRMSPEQGSAVAEIFLSSMKNKEDEQIYRQSESQWADSLLPLKPKMTSDQTNTVTASLRAALDASKSFSSFASILSSLAPWADTMTAEQRQKLIFAVVAAANAKKDSTALLAVTKNAWVAWADHLSADQRREVGSVLLEAMTHTYSEPDEMDGLMDGLTPYLAEMSREQADPAIAAILAKIAESWASPEMLNRWTRYLAAFNKQLTSAESGKVISLCLNAMSGPSPEADLAAFALLPLANMMTSDQKSLVVKYLLARFDEGKRTGFMFLASNAVVRIEEWIDLATKEQVQFVLGGWQHTFEDITDAQIAARILRIYTSASRRLPRDEQLALGLQMLQHPIIAISARSVLIRSLSALTLGPPAPGDNLWAVIAWAQAETAAGQLSGYPPPPLFH